MRDGGAYGCAVPRAYANLNPGLLGDLCTVNSAAYLSGFRLYRSLVCGVNNVQGRISSATSRPTINQSVY